jgi:hypothetical protein
MSDQKVFADVLAVVTAGGPMRVIKTTDGKKSPEEIGLMTPAERLNWNRTFDQSKMPDWKDPRG